MPRVYIPVKLRPMLENFEYIVRLNIQCASLIGEEYTLRYVVVDVEDMIEYHNVNQTYIQWNLYDSNPDNSG